MHPASHHKSGLRSARLAERGHAGRESSRNVSQHSTRVRLGTVYRFGGVGAVPPPPGRRAVSARSGILRRPGLTALWPHPQNASGHTPSTGSPQHDPQTGQNRPPREPQAAAAVPRSRTQSGGHRGNSRLLRQPKQIPPVLCEKSTVTRLGKTEDHGQPGERILGSNAKKN